MNNRNKLIATAAMAGLFAGTTLNAAGIAGQNADGSQNLQDKAPEKSEKAKCSGKDGCPGKKDGEKGEKNACSGKDGCPGKKDGEKGEKDKNACSGKDGCPGKKDK